MPMLIPIAIAAAGALTASQIVMMVALTAYSMYQKRKAEKRAIDQFNKSLTDRLVMVATVETARSIVLGRVRTVDGVVFKGTWGDKSEDMALLIALAGHEIDAIEQIYFGDIPVSIDGSGLVTTAPYGVVRKETTSHSVASTGAPQTVTLPNVPSRVIAVTYRVGRGSDELSFTWTPGTASVSFNSAGVTGDIFISYAGQVQYSYAQVTRFLGGPGQDLSAAMSSRFPSLITSAHKFKGFAGLIVDLRYSQDAYPSGVPAITARVRGARVYDPRTGLTAWSENPALCARHIATHPWAGVAPDDDIDDADVIAAANACDIVHTYTDSAGVSTTRPMYTCSYVASTEVSPDIHMDELVEAMSGKWGWPGGMVRMRAGVYSAPVATITDDWLGPGQRQIVPGPGVGELFNSITPTIADAAQGYVPTPIAAVEAEAYLVEDGERLPTQTTLSAVSFAPQAQHICAIRLREMRQAMALSWPVNMRGFVLEMFDTVSLISPRYGFVGAGKPFEVLGTEFNLLGGIQLALNETGPSVYQPDDEFPENDPEQNTALPLPWVVPTITNLRAYSGTNELLRQSDGTVRTRVRLAFNAIVDQAVLSGGRIEVQYRLPDGGWQTEYFSGDQNPLFLGGLQDGLTYLIRARAHNALCGGDWSESITQRVIGKTEKPPTPDHFLIEAMPDGTRLLKGGYSAATKPADFAGYRIRYRQGAGSYGWADMLPFQTDDGFFTTLPIETNLLMAGAYTLAMVGVDTTGNESAVPVYIVALLPNPRLGDAVAYHQLDAGGWPGSLSDCVIEMDSGAPILRARDQAVWNDWSSSWDTYARWVWDPVPVWSYVVATEDFGSPVAVLPIISFDAVGSVVIEEQHSDDGLTWSAWFPVAGAVTARFVSIRATVSAAGPTGPGVTQVTFIRSMSVIYTGNASVETVNDLDPTTLSGAHRLGAGNYLLPTSRTFIKVTELAVSLQGVGGNWSWSVVSGERDDKHINVFNGGALADPPLIDYTVRGISL